MAKCDEGYPCRVCGEEVENILVSDLYLRYVIGEIDPEILHTSEEGHIRCNPVLAQFIVHEEFEPISAEGMSRKSELDKEFVSEREALVTRGWERLVELSQVELPIKDYPLPEAIQKWSS